MQAQNKQNRYILLGVAAVLVALGVAALFTWGSGNKAAPAATVSVNDIYTEVAQTIAAQLATQQALNPPTTTPFPTLPLAAPTAAVQAPIPTAAPIIASPTTGAIAGCDNSVYVNDITIPDNTMMIPGQTFTKTWLIQNNGTCAWDTNYKLAFASGDLMSGAATPLTLSVPPGQQIKVSVNLVAPSQAGTYTGYWKMINGNSVYFGNRLYVTIKVADATPTNTSVPPTATNTPTLPPP